MTSGDPGSPDSRQTRPGAPELGEGRALEQSYVGSLGVS